MTLISYAQNCEDVILWRALKGVQQGTYIDVGAFSPEIDSVTRAFYDQGWRGLNIEPNPQFLARLQESRPDDINLGLAVGDTSGQLALTVVGDTGLTTANPDFAEQHVQAGWATHQIQVPVRTLASLWAEHIACGRPVHFLKVDVEGYEAAVLRGADWTRQRPWIVVVEATLPNSQVASHAEWEPVLTTNRYRMVYWDGLNRFYLAAEHEDLAPAFATPPNIFDDFQLAGHAQALARAAALSGQLTAAQKALDDLAHRHETLQARADASAHSLATTTQTLHQTETTLDQAEIALQASQAQVASLGAEQDRVPGSARQLDYLLTRSVWEQLLFRPDGTPGTGLRHLLFDKTGQARPRFATLIWQADGRPHRPFRLWLTGADGLAKPPQD